MSSTAIKAYVRRVVREEGRVPYVVCEMTGIVDSVTFSLTATVWQESEDPHEGDSVHLTDVRQHRSGWRAHVARFWRPSDEQQQQAAEKSVTRKKSK